MQQRIQENQYRFPYHHLPYITNGVWRVAQGLWWGYEYLALLEAITEILCRYEPKRILDFGCGDGRLIKELAQMNWGLDEIIGVDISERALCFARAFAWGDSRVHLFQSIDEIDRSLLPVDAVVAMEVFEHIPPSGLSTVIERLHTVLRSNGILLVTCPTTNIPQNPKHYQHFSLDALLSSLGTGFELSEHCYIHRVGVAGAMLRQLVINRFFVVNSQAWLKLTSAIYRKFLMKATERTGAHLVAVFKRSE
jgi:2-polyprenyl-3-methyl-5-hydroxy-6-metoxy-1,4-benzoquinol methylase